MAQVNWGEQSSIFAEIVSVATILKTKPEVKSIAIEDSPKSNCDLKFYFFLLKA